MISLPPSFVQDVENFIGNTSDRRAWIECPEIKVYLRSRTRYIGAFQHKVLDIANIEVTKQYRNQGLYSSLLELFETAAHDILYVESIHDQNQVGLYQRRGYALYRQHPGVTDMVRILPNRQVPVDMIDLVRYPCDKEHTRSNTET